MRPILFLAILFLAGCASPRHFVRTDGQEIAGNAKLEQQKEIDLTVCRGDAEKANLQGSALSLAQAGAREDMALSVFDGCMAQKGYLNRPKPQ
ncbi:hypothetical protein [Methylocystis sp.]|uniref:hypothetical protein n=1 Tax=Methylocystis sp. TaxID=1911079 RepID=UPI0027349D90|nr:hypothetical protein [Methylocystis sp.]MDP3554821.1 hypothetical protein [Methylocystis sp.]